jgi:hypothetical protein
MLPPNFPPELMGDFRNNIGNIGMISILPCAEWALTNQNNISDFHPLPLWPPTEHTAHFTEALYAVVAEALEPAIAENGCNTSILLIHVFAFELDARILIAIVLAPFLETFATANVTCRHTILDRHAAALGAWLLYYCILERCFII